MIEKTIEEIKNAEKHSDERIAQAGKEELEKLRELTTGFDMEWDKLDSNLSSRKAEIFEKYEKEAREEINIIKEKAQNDIAVLENMSSDKESIIASIIKNLLEEKE